MNESYWIKSTKAKQYEKLDTDITTTCVIVGGGIVGVTTAYLLARQGIEVVVVDANQIGFGSSGRNTGKICVQHHLIYSQLEKAYGIEIAKLYYEGNRAALKMMEQIIMENQLKCDFEKMTSFLFTENANEVEKLKAEYEVCKEIGIDCTYYDTLDTPLPIKGAVGVHEQGAFHPKKYVDQLMALSVKIGVKVYENTPVTALEKGTVCELKTRDGNSIRAKHVVIASQFPWYDGLNFYFAKEKGDRSYLMAMPLRENFEKGLFISVEEPTKTFRTYEGEGEKLLIIGGNDHKVGEKRNEEEIYQKIEADAKSVFNTGETVCSWSAQDYMSVDKLPYIGYLNKKSDNIYVATGFGKWGMTNGTLSAMIIRDLILNKETPYADLFNPSRKSPYFTKDFLKENSDVVSRYISGKLQKGAEELPTREGEGKVVSVEGQRYGAYRDEQGDCYIVDITCTHLGCELVFNEAEKTWDCPCHASRFDYKGNVINGPAIEPLRRYGDGKNPIAPKLK